jgi:nicotinamidase-related amidase
MPIDLREILRPASTAVITVECQQGVVGTAGALSALAEAVREAGILPQMARVLDAARRAKAPVAHAIVVRRPDGGGSTMNCRLFAATRKSGGPGMLAGSAIAALAPELGPAERDYVIPRHHGVSIFHDSELDSILRSLDVRTVVLMGVSLNIALIGSTIEAVNRGYQVVIPEDGVTGTPIAYGKAVLENTLRFLATVVRCDDVVSALAG